MNSPATHNESFSLQTKNEDQLAKLAGEYPWCCAVQFYLLHHYKKNNSVQLEKQGEKTALFFNDTNWLNWQLHLHSAQNEKEKKIIKEESQAEKIIEEKVSAESTGIKNSENEKNVAEDIIAFEPLHTTDYFASLGIKITDEPIKNDKLGNQMKSFTEWLKSMKKIHQETLPAMDNSRDEQTDRKIQNIAENSNADAEVVTESMAEVLISQDKIEKAIEVYQKLSLLYPLKSGYFAAKINSIKTS